MKPKNSLIKGRKKKNKKEGLSNRKPLPRALEGRKGSVKVNGKRGKTKKWRGSRKSRKSRRSRRSRKSRKSRGSRRSR